MSGTPLAAIVAATFATTSPLGSERALQQTDVKSSGSNVPPSCAIASVVTATVNGTATARSAQPRAPGFPYPR